MIPPYRRRSWAPLITPLAPALTVAALTLITVIAATIIHIGDGYRLTITITGLTLSAILIRTAARNRDWLLHAWVSRSAASANRWRTDLITITATITLTAALAAATAPTLATAAWVVVIFTAVTAGALYRLPAEYDPTIHQWGNTVHVADNPLPGWATHILTGNWDPTTKLHNLMDSYDHEHTLTQPTRRSEHGFSLVETLVSLLLVATGATTIAMTATGSMNLTRLSNGAVAAHELTSTNLAQTFQTDYINLTHPDTTEPAKLFNNDGMIKSKSAPANLSIATGDRILNLTDPFPLHQTINVPLIGEAHQYLFITCGSPQLEGAATDQTPACVETGSKTITSIIAWKMDGATCTIPNVTSWSGWMCEWSMSERIDEFAQRPDGQPQLTYTLSEETFSCPDLAATNGAICSLTMPTGIIQPDGSTVTIPIELISNQKLDITETAATVTDPSKVSLATEDVTIEPLSSQGFGNVWRGSITFNAGAVGAAGQRTISAPNAATVKLTVKYTPSGEDGEKELERTNQYWRP